jgi:PadR family transcriptional regulator, regulatory protein PadR
MVFDHEQDQISRSLPDTPFAVGKRGTVVNISTNRKLFCMKKYQLGEFEEIVLLTVAVLYKDAYGVSIKKEIETRLHRSVSVGALQTALNRLEGKGFVKSQEGEATPERAGRPRRYFSITASGKQALEYTKRTRQELWDAIPKAVLHPKLRLSTLNE